MGMNKKGQRNTPIVVLLSFLVISFIGFGAYMVFKTPQTAVQPAVTPEQQAQVSIDSNVGKTVSLKARAVDYMTNGLTQVFPPLYCWDTTKPASLVEDATSMGTSGDTSVDGVSVGQTVRCVSFNNSYYGRVKDVTATVQSPPTLELPVDAVATQMAIQLSKDANINTAVRGVTNLTVGASASDSLDNMRIRNNGTNQAFNFYGIAFDVDPNTNISLITVANLQRSNIDLGRLSSTDEFIWTGTPSAIAGSRTDNRGRPLPEGYLVDGQNLDLGAVTVTTKGTFSGANTEEGITIRLVDKARFKSVQGTTTGSILEGAENDAPTQVDVGARDFDNFFSILT